nr:MAG TPA: hypothetical protein [Caudoviricetes sp.]
MYSQLCLEAGKKQENILERYPVHIIRQCCLQ